MTNEFITRITNLLSLNSVEYVITGGVASILHGNKKETFDLDILVTVSEKNIVAIENFIYQLTGLQKKLERDKITSQITRVSSFPFSVDILPRLDGLKTDNIFKNMNLIPWEGFLIPVISQKDLTTNYKSF